MYLQENTNTLDLTNANYGYYAFTLDSLLAAELRSVLSVQIYQGDPRFLHPAVQSRHLWQ